MTSTASALGRLGRTGSPLARKGAALVVIFALVLLGLAFKDPIKVRLRPGDTITAEFSENYNLTAGLSKVKVAGLQVGIVTGIDYTDAGTALVKMKVDDDAIDALGSKPSARVAPLTILGGQYSVELVRGGTGTFSRATIPVSRTSTPVELDRVLAALPEDTRTATRSLVGRVDKTLRAGGTQGLRNVVKKGPEILPPAGAFLTALQGENPSTDLPSVVTNLQALAAVLDERSGAVSSMLDDLDTTTSLLASRRNQISTMIGQLPTTLDATDRGMMQLKETLDRLDVAAARLRPSIRNVDPLLRELGPTLREARPVVAQLPPILRDARVIVNQLVPTASLATAMVDDVRGPVINRIRGPILDKLDRTWHGTGEYKNSGGGIQAANKFYEEIAFMITNLDRSSMTQDAQGSLLNFQAGVGTSTLQPLALDEALARLIPQLSGANN